jgi:hypothetical protein
MMLYVTYYSNLYSLVIQRHTVTYIVYLTVYIAARLAIIDAIAVTDIPTLAQIGLFSEKRG